MKKLIYLLIFLGSLAITDKTFAAGIRLEFKPASLSLIQNENTRVGILLNPSGSRAAGADLVLRYDPELLSIQEIRGLGAFTGELGTAIDNKSGVARAGFLNQDGSYVTDTGLIAEVVVSGKQPTAKGALNFEFIYGKTNDSNVILASGRDGLSSVNSLVFSVVPPAIVNSDNPAQTQKNFSQDVKNGTFAAKFPGVISPLADDGDAGAGAGQKVRNDFRSEIKSLLLPVGLGIFVVAAVFAVYYLKNRPDSGYFAGHKKQKRVYITG